MTNFTKKIAFFGLIILLPFFAKPQECYELVWSDEFNYQGLPDSTLWGFETGGSGFGNNELQYYTSKREKNARVENGHLIIEAHKEAYNGMQYTSARLVTYPNNYSWQYGKIEASLKLPYGQGIWPAFWMLGDNIFEGTSWPACGEIDIMEMVGGGEGKDDKAHGTIHWSNITNAHAQYGGSYQIPTGILADTFHLYSMEWTPTTIKWYFDGNLFHTATITASDQTEFHKKFFLLLNVAVGGNWPGNPNSSTVFPQRMETDFVRIYQKNNAPQIKGDTLINKAQNGVKFSTVESEEFTYEWAVPADAEIVSGQGTNEITVNWGCNEGFVQCTPTTLCNTYSLKQAVKIAPIDLMGASRVAPNAKNIKYTAPQLNNAGYRWALPAGAEIVGPTDTNVVLVNWGSTGGKLMVYAQTLCGLDSANLDVSVVHQLPYPNADVPHAIPGTILSVNYDTGGEGFAYHDSEPDNQGPGSRQTEGVDTEPNDGFENIGWTEPGEWLEYTVKVAESTSYQCELRVSSQDGGGSMEIYFNETNRTGTIAIPRTGSWTTFASVKVPNITLTTADTLMRVAITKSGFNLGRMIFSVPTDVTDETISSLSVYPTMANEIVYVQNAIENYHYAIYNIGGQKLMEGLNEANQPINIKNLTNGMYIVTINSNQSTKATRIVKTN